MLRQLVFLAASAAVAWSALAQTSETIEVQLTNLDVVVTDGKGQRIAGLTKDDFEVLENGVRREITNLSEVRRGPVGAEGTVVNLGAPRRILVAIDNRTIPMSARKRTVAALRRTIEQLLGGPGDRAMIVSIAGSASPRTKWTADRAEIDRVLTEIEQEPAAARLEDTEVNNMFADLTQMAQGNVGAKASRVGRRSRVVSGSSSNDGGRGSAPDEESPEFADESRMGPAVDYNLILTRARAFAGSRQREAKQTIGALATSLNQFAAAPDGRRLVVLVGGTMPLFAGADIFQRLDARRRSTTLR